MQLVFIFGDSAVGKMTVGQSLARITGLSLFHNHMTIEPVIELFGSYDAYVVTRLREVIFEEFAKSSCYGLIFTYMWAFDSQSDRDYIEHVVSIFRAVHPDLEPCYVELIAPQELRLLRNESPNRLANKASKRDLEASKERLIRLDNKYRLVSYEGELTFPKYLRIDNSSLSPDECALLIKETFSL